MATVGNLASGLWNLARHGYVCALFRLAVGITLVIASVGKLSSGGVFVEEVKDYHLLPDALAQVYGSALPWVEIVVGCLLIVGLITTFAAGIAVLASLSLIIANAVVLARGLNLECGCFGDLAALQTREAIIIDSVMLMMALLILVRRRDFLSVDLWMRRRRLRRPME
jgi:uncharacterized membrane protein YphA (DoxX/SURF4 family)